MVQILRTTLHHRAWHSIILWMPRGKVADEFDLLGKKNYVMKLYHDLSTQSVLESYTLV